MTSGNSNSATIMVSVRTSTRSGTSSQNRKIPIRRMVRPNLAAAEYSTGFSSSLTRT